MITHWEVIQEVACRYGSKEPKFEEGARKLALVKEGKIPLVSMEDDLTRVQYRIAREGESMPQALERVMEHANFQDKFVLDKLSEMARAVCRLLHKGNPVGTGFLVAEDILLTNHHVLETAAAAKDLLAEFNYELDANQVPKDSACFRLNPGKFFLTSTLTEQAGEPHSGLDFTLIGVERTGEAGENLSSFPPVFLDGNLGKIIKGEGCVIIQHPKGLPKKIVLKDIAFFSETGTRLVYESDTLPGSSGSMVVGLGTCEVIALHHSGLPRTDSQNRVLTKTGAVASPTTPDGEIAWLGNEGIKISRIVKAVAEAVLPPTMENGRKTLLTKTQAVAQEIRKATAGSSPSPALASLLVSSGNASDSSFTPKTTAPEPKAPTSPETTPSRKTADFLISALNKPETIEQLEAFLLQRYGAGVVLQLSMPASATEGEVELFHLQVSFQDNPQEEAQKLVSFPQILTAEVDMPLRLNADPNLVLGSGETSSVLESTGSKTLKSDTVEEADFLKANRQSDYVKDKTPLEFRKWNWAATGFDQALTAQNLRLPVEKGIRVVQFDTGYSRHRKVQGGFDFELDVNFVEASRETDALDQLTQGFGKFPGHGTRTGSLLIGRENTLIPQEGNVGLLTRSGAKLVPYRIADSVIILDRQQQLAAALDRAISQGFDVITMSMGLPPTTGTAQMAKKAYDKGVIWCCAAGNVVQAVVAPAVFPGAISVAASNPLDRDWAGSSRGDRVDITAPGEAVYVPIWKENRLGDPLQEAFAYGNGTSYATPHVAAAAAYWLAAYQDTLNSPAYAGWRRVEAFRQALKSSARRKNRLPRKGFGAGILDMETLLATQPLPPEELEYAYNSWNEHAFFASLQGYQELVKTYWNRVHGWIFGVRRGNQEALMGEEAGLSEFSQELEKTLFPAGFRSVESEEAVGAPTSLERYQFLHELILSSAK
ncbi:S8 family serine peptidase [Rufibacter psychrotolerans]|uniref:S8 family serine peptidase n=1 Tax=Rufibacter psychrotolerans TaxID=2812556 RepID=UPI00196722DD|nr:S8 family serine peptidase [Rufibacter sp. SYSU D00308]